MIRWIGCVLVAVVLCKHHVNADSTPRQSRRKTTMRTNEEPSVGGLNHEGMTMEVPFGCEMASNREGLAVVVIVVVVIVGCPDA
jgi:hypothetical protein